MSFPKYDNYQETGLHWLGKIPTHWGIRPVSSCFSERREKVSDTEFEALSVTMKGIVPQLEHAAKTDDNDNRKKVCVGDIVINSRSDRKGSSGMSSLNGSVSLINTVLRPQQSICVRFAHHLIRSVNFQEEYFRFGKGIVADLWSTNFSNMKAIQLPIPPLAEQFAIASFLDGETAKIDALVAEQRRLVELLKEKRQAVISHAVTKGLDPTVPMKPSGIDWVGTIPSHWNTPPVFARYFAVLGKMLDENKRTGTHPVSYLRNADVNWDTINVDDLPTIDITPDEYDRFTLQPGDMLICEGGAGIGQTAIWQGELSVCAFQKALHRLRPLKPYSENPRFFYYCMHYVVEAGFVLAGGTATIPHLTGEQLRKYRFPTPPFDEQNEIVLFLDEIVDKFNSLIAEAERAISLLQERRTALISAAVTGKIDVRDFASTGVQT
jgi:type I restriction enzyme S subunit